MSVGLRTYIAHGNCPLDGQAANANGKKRPDICAGPDVWWSQGVPLWIRSESTSTQDICDLAPDNCAATSPPEVLESIGYWFGVAPRLPGVIRRYHPVRGWARLSDFVMRRLQASKSISPSGHHLQVKFRPHLDIVLPPDRSAPGLGDFEWLRGQRWLDHALRRSWPT